MSILVGPRLFPSSGSTPSKRWIQNCWQSGVYRISVRSSRRRFAAWPVMAVQIYQITEEISSEAKNEMNCDSESGSLFLSQQKSSARGPGLSIISGHFITALHTAPNCYKQSGPFLSHPGVGCEGQFDRLLTCPGLSHYHLRGLLKGSKSHPLVCYPFSPFCIMRGFIAHLISSFPAVDQNGFSFPRLVPGLIYCHRWMKHKWNIVTWFHAAAVWHEASSSPVTLTPRLSEMCVCIFLTWNNEWNKLLSPRNL